MREKKRYSEFLVGFALLWVFGITLLRALRRPNDWAETHWLLTYEFGLIKRALPGTLIQPLIASVGSLQRIEMAILLISLAILGLFCGMLTWMGFRVLQKSRWGTESILVLLVFLSSQYVVMLGHLNGYFDSLFMILTFVSILLVLNEASWAAAAVLSIGVLIHESIVLVGLPPVLFAALLRTISLADGSPRSARLSISDAQFLIPFVLPCAILVLLAVNQALLDAVALRTSLQERLAGFEFIREGRDVIASKDLTTSFTAYLVDQAPLFFGRIFHLGYWVRVGPSLAILLIYAWLLLKEHRFSKYLMSAVLLITLLPLSMHAIAWDTSRIWTYPLVVVMLAIWVVYEVGPVSKLDTDGSSLFRTGCVTVALTNIFMPPSLMDAAVDRFSHDVRALLYVPAVVLLVLGLSSKPARCRSTAQETMQ